MGGVSLAIGVLLMGGYSNLATIVLLIGELT